MFGAARSQDWQTFGADELRFVTRIDGLERRLRRRFLLNAGLVMMLCLGARNAVPGSAVRAQELPPAGATFGIQVVDRETQRGVPLVELVTTDDVRYITDNAGRIALEEPELDGRTVFFSVQSPGYEVPADGFGIRGVRLNVTVGGSATVEVDRTNIAERLYRVTGRDLYRDSVRLGYPVPLAEPFGSGYVTGQDSVQVAVYRNRLRWFWGDTNRLSYPLGLFRTAGAVSALPAEKNAVSSESASGNGFATRPDVGIDLKYFTKDDGFARAMVDVPDPNGVVWVDGVCTVLDQSGDEKMVAHYSRRPGLDEQLEHGLLIYDDEREIFEVLVVRDLTDNWRFVRDHPTRALDAGTDYLLFGNPYPVTRVKATLEAVCDPLAYESWSCMSSVEEPAGRSTTGQSVSSKTPERDAAGHLVWRWRSAAPTTQKDELRWLRAGLIRPDEARFVPNSPVEANRPVLLHSGTVFFNHSRDRWIMIAVESKTTKDSPSFLGEIWYSESAQPQGPFRDAVKIATHPGQSFYNPCHHPYFDQDGGRFIYFEGTYCNTFTSSPATQRYNYNQLMYRLDLQHPSIRAAQQP